MATDLLQMHYDKKQTLCESILCENCEYLKNQLCYVQEELISARVINKILQEAIVTTKANLDMSNRESKNNKKTIKLVQ
jgi:hypothetical protein